MQEKSAALKKDKLQHSYPPLKTLRAQRNGDFLRLMDFQRASANFLLRWALGQRTTTLIYIATVLEKTHTTETESDSGRIGNEDEE